MRRSLALLALSGLCALGSAQAWALGDPIEGTWTNSLGGAVAVSATSATHFVGNVTVAWNPGNGCSYSVGQTVWEFDKRFESDGIYRGIVHGFAATGGCVDETQTTTWMVFGSSLQMCVSGFACDTYTRSSAPPPPPPPPAPKPKALQGSVSAAGITSLSAKTVASGSFVLTVTDRSGKGNFHLTGPGVNRTTGLAFKGTAVWKLNLSAGVYRYTNDVAKAPRKTLTVRA